MQTAKNPYKTYKHVGDKGGIESYHGYKFEGSKPVRVEVCEENKRMLEKIETNRFFERVK
jgi:hypothetical protein